MIKIDAGFIAKWEPRYDWNWGDEDEYIKLIKTSHKEIKYNRELSHDTFKRIISWKKAGRGKYNPLKRPWSWYKPFIIEAYNADEEDRIAILSQEAVRGIHIPVASTILHFIFPDIYPIIDRRTAGVLYYAELLPYKTTGSLINYSRFKDIIRGMLTENPRRSYRELDRALMAFHYYNLNESTLTKKKCRC